ncbi:Nitrosoguanidine resistance protein SNG1 [Hypsizygus marmoreus]|uniref:Nitrosoguanidine resistance protein SNG1 n=1 Tax=Hypsizygus marmoreus TaxID=39966 RepID=A0A369J4E3_HYPMA|nr:Nitrosoguanidine resistance protein SNG1 [Hypsizygus marmoreus]
MSDVERIRTQSSTRNSMSSVNHNQNPSTEIPFSRSFFDKNNAVARSIYLKIVIGGCFSLILTIFAVFPIYWGALWKTPVHNLNGWVIDFDGGRVGQTVVQALTSPEASQLGKVTWTAVPASQFPDGLGQLGNAVVNEQTWVAIAIHAGSTARLQASYASPNASYTGTDTITVYAAEARNENAYRSLIRPSAQAALEQISQTFAIQSAAQLASSANLTALLATSPQTVITPIGYTVHNLAPFDMPVASAVTFVGLIYQLILSFFVVMISFTAREHSRLNQHLTLRSLIVTRFVSSFTAYFFVSLFYALLSLAFQLDFTRKFGHSGFLVFWMLNWVGMLSVGLALESLMTLLTPRGIPFFMILWIIINVSVCFLPIEVLPIFFRYGYAMPFYNVSHAVRCIVFGTKDSVGLNFGVLIAWAVTSCISLPLIQWFVRRRDVLELQLAARSGISVAAQGNDEKQA